VLLGRIKTADTRDGGRPRHGDALARRLEIVAREIPDAYVAHLPAAHIRNVEVSGEFNRAVQEFLLAEPAARAASS
jgi:hypothetical protein